MKKKLPIAKTIRSVTCFSALPFLFTGIFLPLFEVPLRGSLSLYSDSTFESAFILVSISLAIFFGLLKRFHFIWISVILTLTALFHFISSLHKRLESATFRFDFLKTAVLKNSTIQWSGWIFLIIGCILLIWTSLPESCHASFNSRD